MITRGAYSDTNSISVIGFEWEELEKLMEGQTVTFDVTISKGQKLTIVMLREARVSEIERIRDKLIGAE